MIYEQERNNIIRKYVNGIYHLNWIKLDGNTNIEHNKKVCDICIELRKKGLDFLTRPKFIVTTFDEHYNKIIDIEEFYPDILCWVKNPFVSITIEVLDSEDRIRAESKNYPEEFKVIVIDVDEDIEGMF